MVECVGLGLELGLGLGLGRCDDAAFLEEKKHILDLCLCFNSSSSTIFVFIDKKQRIAKMQHFQRSFPHTEASELS